MIEYDSITELLKIDRVAKVEYKLELENDEKLYRQTQSFLNDNKSVILNLNSGEIEMLALRLTFEKIMFIKYYVISDYIYLENKHKTLYAEDMELFEAIKEYYITEIDEFISYNFLMN